jgi:formylglycine-generating enzyme required for sulfatase activity
MRIRGRVAELRRQPRRQSSFRLLEGDWLEHRTLLAASPLETAMVTHATNAMDAILFHPNTSIRRAIILVLGTYGADSPSHAERDRMIAKLLDFYQNDPDAGIHGAAEWTLRQWKQEGKVKSVQAELSKLKDKGARRWFVNSQGQTFAVIEGSVEFGMGSPRSESDRDADETPHSRIITRRFAIADQEVTVEQYERFVHDGNSQFGLSRSYLDRYSPEPNCPMVAVSWFGAAAYCNWLSKQEGLPKDEWCYLPNEQQEYNAGMKIPADAFKRTGYRLPAEPEWEYACRAGTTTNRYYGLSVGLLEVYARYDPRLLRGGAFYVLRALVRPAYRLRYAPTDRVTNPGFRLARTYH